MAELTRIARRPNAVDVADEQHRRCKDKAAADADDGDQRRKPAKDQPARVLGSALSRAGRLPRSASMRLPIARSPRPTATTIGIAPGPTPYIAPGGRPAASHTSTAASAASKNAMTRPAPDRRAAGESGDALIRRHDLTRPTDLSTSVTRTISFLQEIREGVTAEIGVRPTLLLEGFLPGVRLDHLLDRLAERLLLLGSDAGRRDHRAPVGEHEIDPLLLEGRDIHAGQPVFRGDADGAQLAGLDLPFIFAEARNARSDLGAEDGRQRFAAAGERDVVDLLCVRADRAGEQCRHHVVDAAGRAAGESDFCDVGFHRRGQILRGLDRRARRHHDDLDLLGEARDRRHLLERDRRFVHGERAHHDEAVHHQLVAVALGAIDELRDANAAAGARNVGHLHAARDFGSDEGLLHRPGGRSHPPPGAAGAITFSSSCCANEGPRRRVSATTAPNKRLCNRVIGRSPGGARLTLMVACDI